MTQSYLIHCKPSQEQLLTNSDLMWSYNDEHDFDEIDVIVEDVEDDPELDHLDTDEQLCVHYDINYDFVNCIEARNFTT